MKPTYVAIQEVMVFARFFMVGIFATLIHMSVAILLISQFSVAIFVANLIAYLVAFFFAFSGHFIWTFERKANFPRSLVRYFVISIIAFAINNLVLLGLVKKGLFPETFSVVLAAAVIPLVSFTASRLWGFKS